MNSSPEQNGLQDRDGLSSNGNSPYEILFSNSEEVFNPYSGDFIEPLPLHNSALQQFKQLFSHNPDSIFNSSTTNTSAFQFHAYLHQQIDALDNITTYANPTINMLYRDASFATLDEAQDAHKELTRLKLTCFQRSFDTLRGVLYSIHQSNLPENLYKTIRQKIIRSYYKLLNKQTASKQEFNAEEKYFNRQLINELISANILKKKRLTKQYQRNLLIGYRSLASVLTPAPIISTLTMTPLTDATPYQLASYAYHLEEAHPITQKTQLQRQQLQHIINHLAESPIDQIKKNIATLLQQNDRCLSALDLSLLSPTIKNGFITKSTNFIAEENSVPNDQINISPESIQVHWTARHAALAYSGKDHRKKAARVAETEANVSQRFAAATALKAPNTIHTNLLMTNSRRQRQHRVYYETRRALDKTKLPWSSQPVNAIGALQVGRTNAYLTQYRFQKSLLQDNADTQLKAMHQDLAKRQLINIIFRVLAYVFLTLAAPFLLLLPFFRRRRHQLAAAVTLSAMNHNNALYGDRKKLSAVSCMNGQDYTGTNLLLAEAKQFQTYLAQNKTVVSDAEAINLIAKGRHQPTMASILNPGAYGLRDKTKVFALLPKAAERATYTNIADDSQRPNIAKKAHHRNNTTQHNENDFDEVIVMAPIPNGTEQESSDIQSLATNTAIVAETPIEAEASKQCATRPHVSSDSTMTLPMKNTHSEIQATTDCKTTPETPPGFFSLLYESNQGVFTTNNPEGRRIKQLPTDLSITYTASPF